MKRIGAFLFVFLPTIAAAQTTHHPWERFQNQCRDEIMAEQCLEHNCYQLWKPIAKCTVEHASSKPYPASSIELCIGIVDAERTRRHLATAIGDPIADVFSCLRGGART